MKCFLKYDFIFGKSFIILKKLMIFIYIWINILFLDGKKKNINKKDVCIYYKVWFDFCDIIIVNNGLGNDS